MSNSPADNCPAAGQAPGSGSNKAAPERAAAFGLVFFGRISASISHELKNTLSIMNESAGLLEDLAQLVEQGKPLDASRVSSLAATIKRQIQRTDQIIRNMNRFSHSVDDPFKEIDLVDFLDLVLAVSRRLTTARGVTLSVDPSISSLMVVTRPFFLHHLLWKLFEFAMTQAETSKALVLRLEKTGLEVLIQLTGVRLSTGDEGRGWPDPETQILLDSLESTIRTDTARNVLELVLPHRITSQLPA